MLNPGQLIDGRYRILRQLGEGGMGAVYEAENQRILRQVAIKVLHSDVSQDAGTVERFEREAQAAGRIGNKHIVEVLDLGSLPTGERYMVMELLHGIALGDYLKQHRVLSAQVAVRIASQMLDALSAAHTVGIIHRDLKPDNLFLVEDDDSFLVKLLDFGISKFSEVAQDMGVTRTGSVIGTPQYMAPEQARGLKDIDQRVDVYAAGVVLYEMLCGRRPFFGETINEIIIKVATEHPPSLTEWAPGLDPGLVQIVDRAIANDRDARFPSAQSFLAALVQWQGQGGAFDVTQSNMAASRTSLTEQLSGSISAGLHTAGIDTRMASSPPTRTSSAWKVPKSGAWAHTHDGEVPELEGLRRRGKWPLWLTGAAAMAIGGFAAYSFWPVSASSTVSEPPIPLNVGASASAAVVSVDQEPAAAPTAPTTASSEAPSASAAATIEVAVGAASAATTQSAPAAEAEPSIVPVAEKAAAPKASRSSSAASSHTTSSSKSRRAAEARVRSRSSSSRTVKPIAAAPPPPPAASPVKRSTASQGGVGPRRHKTIRRDLDL